MNFNHEELMLMMLYNTGIRLGPVSYTHLDVYKRQAKCRRRFYPACTYAIALSLLWITALYHKERIAVRISTHP